MNFYSGFNKNDDDLHQLEITLGVRRKIPNQKVLNVRFVALICYRVEGRGRKSDSRRAPTAEY